MNLYRQGSLVKCSTVTPFTKGSTPTNPSTVSFSCKKPDGTLISATWTASGGDSSGTIVNDSAGTFHAFVSATVIGADPDLVAEYRYKFGSPAGDPVQAVDWQSFGVTADPFLLP